MVQNNLPPNWSWVKLGDVAEFKNGINFSKNQKGEAGILTIDVYNMYNNSIYVDLQNLYRVDKEIRNEHKLKNGDLLFVRSSVKREGVGFATAFRSFDEDVTYCGFIIRARLSLDKLLPEYATYFFRSSSQRNKIVSKAKQVTISNISQDGLSALTMPLPPLPEQKKIVEKIEELFSQLDSGVASLKKAKEQIRLYRQSVLASAFNGKLTPGHLKLVSESNELPNSWKWVKLGEVLEVKDGTHDTPEYKEKGIPFITQKNIKNGEFVFDNYNLISKEDHQQFYKRSNVTFNDIIISMIGANRGMSTIVKTKEIFSIKNVGLIKIDEKKFQAKYLDYFFKSEIGQNSILSKSKGGAQQFIGLTELRNWLVPQQSLHQQTQIVEEIDKRFSEADNLEKAIDESLNKAEALRQSILKQAFEGKLI